MPSMDMPSLSRYLRDGTAVLHGETEALFARIGMATLDEYSGFLRAQAGALIRIESGLAPHRHGFDSLNIVIHPRGMAILRDMVALRVASSFEPLPPETYGWPEALGAAYVLEGSHLGAKMLLRQLPHDSWPRDFLSAPGMNWREFVERLDSAGSALDVEKILNGAESAFIVFLQSAQREIARKSEIQ